MLCSISASSAAISGPGNVLITPESSDEYAKLTVNQKVYSIEKGKVPKKYKKYENYTFQVAKGKKIKFKASVNTNGNAALITDMSGVKIKNAYITFGDGAKKRSTSWISHTYKKTGWYKIKVTFNATFNKCKFLGMDSSGTGQIVDASKEYLVYVANKPQLGLSNIKAGYSSYKNYKKGNINFLDVKITNTGSVTSKASKIKIWYEQPNKFGKVYSKLKKYTKTAKLKALKSGKSTTVRIYFSIPKKYSKLWKNIRLDSLNKINMISRKDALLRFR